MASGSVGGGFWGGGGRSGGGGGRSGGSGGRRYTMAKTRRVNERYMAPSRASRRGVRGGSVAVPSRWFL